MLGWHDRIYPYVKNEQLFVCPTHDIGGQDEITAGVKPAGDPAPNRMVTSYASPNYLGMLGNVWAGGSWDTKLAGVSLTAIPRPVDIVMWAEGPGQSGTQWASFAVWKSWLANSGAMDRHNKGANYGFCDGHAKWMARAEIYQSGDSSDSSGHWFWWVE